MLTKQYSLTRHTRSLTHHSLTHSLSHHSPTHPLAHSSLTYSPTHSLTLSLSLTHSLTHHSLTHPLTYSPTHPLTHSLTTHSLTHYSLTYSFTHSYHFSSYPFPSHAGGQCQTIHSFTHSLTLSLTHSITHSLFPPPSSPSLHTQADSAKPLDSFSKASRLHPLTRTASDKKIVLSSSAPEARLVSALKSCEFGNMVI